MNTWNKTEGCKGCLMDELSGDGICTFPPINKKGEFCPCQTCLVKMVCKTGCTAFRFFNYSNEDATSTMEDR